MIEERRRKKILSELGLSLRVK
jgi:pleiotropic regulator 1